MHLISNANVALERAHDDLVGFGRVTLDTHDHEGRNGEREELDGRELTVVRPASLTALLHLDSREQRVVACLTVHEVRSEWAGWQRALGLAATFEPRRVCGQPCEWPHTTAAGSGGLGGGCRAQKRWPQRHPLQAVGAEQQRGECGHERGRW
eukprot:scaffold230697_cov32-Tisochrysis_lutea.AAC.1